VPFLVLLSHCVCWCSAVQDVAELARLKILGGKLKKSAARKEPPSAVLQAMQQQRQEAEGALVDGPLGHGALPAVPSSPDAAAAAAVAALGAPPAGRMGGQAPGMLLQPVLLVDVTV
jgi:hypothetical protein